MLYADLEYSSTIYPDAELIDGKWFFEDSDGSIQPFFLQSLVKPLTEPSTERRHPKPPRCRGIRVSEGVYAGCAYGYGDVAPFTPPCDCPVCNGSGLESGYQPN